MNTNDRATLRKWINRAWIGARTKSNAAHYASAWRGERYYIRQAARWARFAQACETRLREIEKALEAGRN